METLEALADCGGTSGTHDALNRMRRAYERGTGCHLTAEMIQSMSVSIFGQMWSEEDPRAHLLAQKDVE